ncbi:TlyA family rRNA (cytidine-2'-O)-methyltransferase [Rhodocyclaceae bacterium]|nr:TlyA family rRNA (cytidine-2'-O)-methyltransferase [Rhodocyclaceae bacterium]
MSMNSFHARARRPRPSVARHRPAAGADGMLRADALLVAQGLAESRTRARQLIEDGRVAWDGGTVAKPAQELPVSARLSVAADEADRYVSRGGLKLAGALAASGVAVAGRICLDVGQSTGGFSDCLLAAGAARVVGIDVGHGQLHPRLANVPHCITLEGVNARHLTAAVLGEHYPPGGFDVIVCDASFISLTLLLPQWPALLAAKGDILALVKPQFEVGPQGLAKGGIVRDARLYREVENKLRAAAHDAGLAVCGWYDSPIAGGDGNREFFIWMQHSDHAGH